MLVVVALGGNALLTRGQPLEPDLQLQNLAIAAQAIAEIACDHRVVVTHGNGPQIGLLALQAEAYAQNSPFPLDVLGAQTEGMIGYLLEQQLASQLPDRQVATLLTQVAVNPYDPAFSQPSKPIGPIYSQPEAERLAQERGWAIAPDGAHYRRVVPSPEPLRILELVTIRLLLAAGVLVICVGGGGIPVVVNSSGSIHGVEAVIDKDLAAALLAQFLNADALLLLTDVDAVYQDWGTSSAHPLRRVTPQQLQEHSFAPGSMAPKVEAASRFVNAGSGFTGIGRLEDAVAILAEQAGTIVRKETGAVA